MPARGEAKRSIERLAARMLREDGTLTLSSARRKAASRLGYTHHLDMPALPDVERALIDELTLFRGAETALQLRQLRALAVRAMQFLEPFRPLLVGSVLSGAITSQTRVTLHLFSDTAEEIIGYLEERGIPATLGERRYRRYGTFPCLDFFAGDVAFRLVIFPHIRRRQAPPSDTTGRPMQRADEKTVRGLLDENAASGIGNHETGIDGD